MSVRIVAYLGRSYNAGGGIKHTLNTLTRLETLLEGLAERSFARLFRSRLQPVEIAKRLAREMEAGRIVGVSSILVPNRYRVALSSEDYAAFAPIRLSLEHEMVQYLESFARDHGYALTSRPDVEILEAPALRPGRMVAAGQFTEPPPAETSPTGPVEVILSTEPLERTRVMPRVPSGPAPVHVATSSKAFLTLDDSAATYSLDAEDVALGRGLENTIVLEDRRVSRSHARLVLSGDRWVVRDEGSTNGTFVNGRMVSEQTLNDGDLLSLGGLELVFHQR